MIVSIAARRAHTVSSLARSFCSFVHSTATGAREGRPLGTTAKQAVKLAAKEQVSECVRCCNTARACARRGSSPSPAINDSPWLFLK